MAEDRRRVDFSLDELTQGMASGTISRGRALKTLAGMAVAALLPFGASKANAKPKCRGVGHPCEGNQVCCPGLVCRVTGPGNAERCAKPNGKKSPPPPPKKSPPPPPEK